MSRRLLCGCLVDGYILESCPQHAHRPGSLSEEEERSIVVKRIQAFRVACIELGESMGVPLPSEEITGVPPQEVRAELLETANELQVEIVALCLPQTQEGE